MSSIRVKWRYVLMMLLVVGCGCDEVKYTVASVEGGGYVLHVKVQRRRLHPMSAEGMFPVETGSYKIEIAGKGEDWSYIGREGVFYRQEEVMCDRTAWEYCYAWVDQRRDFLYLNAYWIVPPNKLVRSSVAGKYALRGPEQGR